ncbi:MAG: Rpn family recombination-promoting nuclease/putative transposase [Chlamydiota bacterium]
MTLLNPRVDLAFKILFGSEENKDLLISFINSVVSEEDQVVEVELLNPYNSRSFKEAKGSILDIKAKDASGKYFDIEVQISDEGDYDKRALLYWAKLYADQMISGDDYSGLRKAIGIHVLNFTCIPDNSKYDNKFIITEANTGKCYFKDLAIYTIELSKFDEKSNETLSHMLPRIKTGLDRWSTFLTKAASLDRNNLPKELEDPCIKKALDVLTTASLNKEEREIYEGHLKWLRVEFSTIKKAKADSKAEGLAEGEAKKAKEIARNLLKIGTSIPTIAAVSGLSEEEIENL